MNYLLILVSLTSLSYTLITFICSIVFFRQKKIAATSYPPVTILKPVKGIDHSAYENFISYCELDYPQYQLIFCVQSKEDPIIPLIEKIKNYYSKMDIEIVVSNHKIGENAKVNNLNNGYQKAKHEIIVYNDSDTRADPHYLKSIVPHLLNAQVGAVTAIPIYRDAQHWVAAMESVGINADTIPSFAPLAITKVVDFCVGVTIAVKRKVLEEVGGFKAVVNNICDDGLMGRLIHQKGYTIILSSHLVSCIHHHSLFKDFYAHVLRWFTTIRAFTPFKFCLCLFMFGNLYSGLYWILNPASFSAMLLFATVLFSRLLSATLINIFYIKDKNTLRYIWLLPFRDFLFIIVWIHSWFKQTVTWRGILYKIRWGGKVESA